MKTRRQKKSPPKPPAHPHRPPPRPRRGFWSRLRIYFRRFRATVWTLVIITILGLLWLNQIGLPGFLKRPLLEKLRAQGIELSFTTLRLSWSRGFVAYDVHFGRAAGGDAGPKFSARRIEVPLDSVALRHLDFEIGGLVVADGLLRYPINETNQPARELTVTNLNATLHFLPGDEWRLENLSGRVAGINLLASADLAHASALRQRRAATPAPKTPGTNAPAAKSPPPEAVLRAQLRQFADAIELFKFPEPPGLRVSLSADARDWQNLKLNASLDCKNTVTRWGELGRTRLTLRTAGFSAVALPDTAGTVAAPKLAAARLQTSLNGGPLDLAADLDLASRALRFRGTSDFDIQLLQPLLPPKTARWLAQYSWETPPHFAFTGGATLPAWTNQPAAWTTALADTLVLDGEFHLTRAAFRGVTALTAESRFSYTNLVWRLPDLTITRPEGVMHVTHWTDDRTRDYFWRLTGAFDPAGLRPLLDADGQRGLDLARFTAAPQWDGEISGRWRANELLHARARVAATNFTFRGEKFAAVRLTADYTNLFLAVLAPEIIRAGDERATLDGVGVDFRTMLVHLTNGVSTMDGMVIGRCIGPKTAKSFEPYEFLQPPRARVDGTVPLAGNHHADLRVNLDGGPFRWWRFNVANIAGDLRWQDESLTLTNVTMKFYDGRAHGDAAFDFTPETGDDFRFSITFRDANLAALMADVAHSTNQLEGFIDGRLDVDHANTDDWKSWHGAGDMHLRNGLLWEIPVFGVFAPVLNTIWPNLGSGRASQGTATFTITNSVIRSDNLELRSPMMRMQYRGTVDFQGNLDARVEAELLRNTWVIGPVVSTVLWPVSKALEFKVTGTLGHPKPAPVYIPKAFLAPFNQLRSLREMFVPPPETPDASPH